MSIRINDVTGEYSVPLQISVKRSRNVARLIESVHQNDLSGLRMMLDRGADPGRSATRMDENRAIHAAIESKLEAATALGLNSGADADTQDELGNSALHYAAQGRTSRHGKSLALGHGADVDMADCHGNTPLWRAVFNSQGRGEVIRVLLGAGADRNHRNKHGKTPMDLAESMANYNVLQYLL